MKVLFITRPTVFSGPVGDTVQLLQTAEYLKKYDVGTGRDREENLEFDTPMLIELWRSAPYLHDGRAVTMKDVLTKDNHDDKHGRTSNLTAEQINDLVQFVLSL